MTDPLARPGQRGDPALTGPSDLAELLRPLVPRVLSALARRHSDFAACEDAVQEALLAATTQWPQTGVPVEPAAWLITVAHRRYLDGIRAATAQLRREVRHRQDRSISVAGVVDPPALPAPAASHPLGDDHDVGALLVLCCDPALPRPAQVALTLRAVCGLTTDQIAALHLVPSATVGQRISRAKTLLRTHHVHFDGVPAELLPQRLNAVLDVLYLLFTEGHTSSAGSDLHDVSLTREAIRVTRMLAAAVPEHDEATGLLALMLLTDARAGARVDPAGDLVPLGEQDRTRWDRRMIREGTDIVEQLLPSGEVGRFQLLAAVAAVHADAPSADRTDWLQIVVLYRMLDRIAPGPMTTLALAVAVGEAHGAEAGLAVVAELGEPSTARLRHRLHAVRGHLLEAAGDHDGAIADYRLAAALTSSAPEQRHLNARAVSVEQGAGAAAAPPDPERTLNRP
ncbi:DUF6596 domain-containing protein [Nakamurella sp. A5-74]|uniref:DUF6596 domain-containing protein n=1 Tax=Nakamurella sp. A5-74 TaxID=3158264 RepID=A0AAU8DXJ7_9ACTN